MDPLPSITNIQKDYFRNNGVRKDLKKGEVLMTQGGFNDKLYLVLDGLLIAYLEPQDEGGEKTELFRAVKDQFVGVYSFFSQKFKSHTTIVADEDTALAYITAEAIENLENTDEVIRNFLPVILEDMNRRQETVWQMAGEKQKTLTQLLQVDKMRTLGQLSAGLAHELNNAIGVVRSKTEWLADEIAQYLKDSGDKNLYPFFEKGWKEGQFLSSSEVRKRRKEIQEKFGMDYQTAKEIARTGLTMDELDKIGKRKLNRLVKDIDLYWDIGNAFHDIKLASGHAADVVQSVKELGAGGAERKSGLSVAKTIHEALILLKSNLRTINVQTEMDETLTVKANSGELVQVWINIIKNACESMVSAGIQEPTLKITVSKKRRIHVHIIDNGPGIPKELREKIFQPDFTTKKGGLSFGLGLGLPISVRIIESYDGTMAVASEPGKTDFRILLPMEK